MRNKKLLFSAVSAAVLAASCVSTYKNDNTRQVASDLGDLGGSFSPVTDQQKEDHFKLISERQMNFANQNPARQFSNADAAKLSAAPNLKLTAGKIITDNDLSFQTKLEMIKKATKEIRMVYFIYQNDLSSSVLNQALIEKAQNGVKVKLLVDFITNYAHMDLFQMMYEASGGKMEIYFYNFPSNALVADSNYLTMPCPAVVSKNGKECQEAKMQALRGSSVETPTAMGKMFLTGLYAKSPTLMMLALSKGAAIDPNVYKAQMAAAQGSGQDNSDDIKKLAKIIVQAASGSLKAKIELSIAMSMKGQLIAPVMNEITGRLPLASVQDESEHGKAWDHLSDYTHHKLLVIDGTEFILGGRNVENSYHMKIKNPSGKYVFMDTDFWGATNAGGARAIETSYDKIIGSPIVAKFSKVNANLYNDLVANLTRAEKTQPSATELAIAKCDSAQGDAVIECVNNEVSRQAGYKSLAERVASEKQLMSSNVGSYRPSAYASNGEIALSAAEASQASVYYVQNTVTFSGPKQNYGSRIGQEAAFGKNIQATWYRGLENVCVQSRQSKEKVDVVFHSAYLLMPSGMIHQLGKMMNGDYGNCSNVKVTFITNSPDTTDLGPINVLARYQLGALFTYYKSMEQYYSLHQSEGFKKFYPELKYYEYTKVAHEAGSSDPDLSLHTKTSLIGNDLIVGSANADVRSYYMDTNDAVLVRNATSMNKAYLQFVNDIINKSGRVEDRLQSFVGKTLGMLGQENEAYLSAAAKKYKKEGMLTEERLIQAMQAINKAGYLVYQTTQDMLYFRDKFSPLANAESGRNDFATNKALNDAANNYDSLFKVF